MNNFKNESKDLSTIFTRKKYISISTKIQKNKCK